MATDHNFKVKNGLTVQGSTLVVNNTENLSGTQVYIKRLDGSTNLQRWGEGTSGASTYRFRIDQNFKFIGNSGSGDTIQIRSDTGALTTPGSITITSNSNGLITRQILARDVNGLSLKTTGGTEAIGIDNSANVNVQNGTIKVSGTTVIDNSRRFYPSNIQSGGAISFLNGSAGTTGTGAQGISVRDLYAGTTYANRTGAAGTVDALNGFKVAGTDVIDASRNLTNIAAATIAGDVLINGAGNNSGKADFAVGVGGNPGVSWYGNQVQIGGTDMNYNARLYYTGSGFHINVWDNNLTLGHTGSNTGSANARDIIFSPQISGTGASTERMRLRGTDGILEVGKGLGGLVIDSGGNKETIEGRRYNWYLHAMATQTDYYKVCTVSIASGLYKALAMKVVVESQLGNYGHTASIQSSEFNIAYNRSGATQDDANNAVIYGTNPTAHTLRVVKTATGTYELQIKQDSSYRDATVKIQVLSTNGGTIQMHDGFVVGSSSGTAYTADTNSNAKNFFPGNVHGHQYLSEGTASNSVPKYSFEGDTNTGLGYIGSDAVGLISGGSRKFYVSASSGAFFQNIPSVSIVTTGTGDARHFFIDGPDANYDFRSNSTSGYTTTFNMDNTGLEIGHNSSGRNLALQTNSTDRLTIGGGGDVSIASNLSIGNELSIPAAVVHVGDTNTTFGFHGNDLFRVVTGGTERFEVSNSGIIINDGGSDYNFRVESDDNANMLFVDGGNDRVGIGIGSPASKLHVHGTQSYGSIRISPTSANGESAMAFFLDTAGTTTSTAWVVGHAGWGNTGDFVIGNQAFGGPVILAQQDGKVGIGTTSPSTTLHIVNTSNNSDVLKITTTGDDPDRSMTFQSDHIFTTNGDLHLGINGRVTRYRGTRHEFQTGSSNTERLEISDSGIKFHDAYTFPTSDGSANQVLQTDGSGNLSFATVSSGSTNATTLNGQNAAFYRNASNLNAGTIPTARLNQPTSGNWWSGGATVVQTDGVMEIGKYIDFHNTDTATSDFDVRLQVHSTNNLSISGNGRILTTADEGSGNGLDADSVDGNHASSFLRSGASDTIDNHNSGANLNGSYFMQGWGGNDHSNNGPIGDFLRYKDATLWGYDGSSWTNLGNCDGVLDGDYGHQYGGLTLSQSYQEFVIDFGSNLGYSFAGIFRMQHSTSGNSMAIYLETKETITNGYESGYTTEASITGVSSWPGETVQKVSFGIGAGYRNNFRIRIVPTFSHASNNITIGGIQLLGFYGSMSKAYSTTHDRDFNFHVGLRQDGTTVIDSSRNLTNIGTISSGAITATNITSTSNSGSASIYINSTRPTLGFTDSNSFSDANDIYLIRGTGGNKLQFQFYDDSAGSTTETFNIDNSGNATFAGTISGTSYSGSLVSGVTGTTQAASDNSTKIATTAYVTTAVSNLVDSAPGTLNTLNELAAALGDDASFSTTVTNSIAAKLPLAGGTMSGTLNMNSNRIASVKSIGFTNSELTDINGAYQMVLDANDSDTNVPAHGSISGSYPLGIYVTGDNGNATTTLGSGLVKVWHTGHFSKSHIDYFVGLQGTGVTTTEFDYLDGVTSNIQTQLNAKAPSSTTTTANAALPKSGGTMTGTTTSRDILMQAGYHLQRSDHHTGHLEGSYNNIGGNSTKTNPIYSIGSNYNPASTTLSNFYGIGFSKNTASFMTGDLDSGNNSGWGMYVAADGDARIFLNGSHGIINSTGQHYADGQLVWNAGNDGAGSGLDADTVDGIQGASFARQDANNTGNIVIAKALPKLILDSPGSGDAFSSQGAQISLGESGDGGSAALHLTYRGDGYAYIGMGVLPSNGIPPYSQIRFTYNSNDIRFNSTPNVTGSTMWHAGNDGSGSGLDADTVDGKHKDFLMHYKGVVSGNWDTIFSQTDGHMGVYEVQNISSGHSNYPTGSYTYGGVLSWQLDNSTFKLYAPHTGTLWYQTGWNNDEYSGWRKVWDNGNDGSGSGLDADLLDGVQGSSYARVDAGNDYTNYANNQHFYSNTNMATGSGNQASLECFSNGSGNDAFMTFHVGGDFACYFGLDGGTNKLSVGGWSMGANSYAIYHEGNKPTFTELGINSTNINALGINATTVDGIDSGSFLRSDAADTATGQIFFDAGFDAHPIMLSGTVNMDNVDRSGFYNLYNINSGSTGYAGFPYGTMIAIGNDKGSAGFGLQIAHERTNTQFKVRGMNDTGSAWSSWAHIWTSATDGSGSGLDADMVDSLHASQFLRSDADDVTSGQIASNHTNNGDAFVVQKNGTTVGKLKVTNASSMEIQLTSDGNNKIGGNNGSDYLSFFTGGAEEMRLENDGDLHVDNDVVAFSSTVSDIRLKENIKPIKNATDKVKRLAGVTFDWKKDGKQSAGLIAQDVEKVLPSAVKEKELPLKTDDGKEYKTVQYNQVIGLLVEAVKEQQETINKLTDRINGLENKEK